MILQYATRNEEETQIEMPEGDQLTTEISTLSFKTSPSTAKLDAAIAKAQGKIVAAVKDSTNPHFKSKYADLASVWAAIRAPLASEGVAVTQWPIHTDDGKIHMLTRIAHDGEFIISEFSMPVAQVTAHGYGSAITYLRRYALSSAIGVVADEDDDGNGAIAGCERPARAAQQSAPGSVADLPAASTPKQDLLHRLGVLLKDSTEAIQNAVRSEIRRVGKTRLGDMTDAELTATIALVEKEIGREMF